MKEYRESIILDSSSGVFVHVVHGFYVQSYFGSVLFYINIYNSLSSSTAYLIIIFNEKRWYLGFFGYIPWVQ